MRDLEDINVTVVGIGYVGLSIVILLAQHHKNSSNQCDL